MLSKIELFNAKNAGKKIEEGIQFTVTSIGCFTDTDKDGKPVEVSALKTDDGAIYTTISATIRDSLDMLDDILSDNGSVRVQVVQNKSNSGRDFYMLKIVD